MKARDTILTACNLSSHGRTDIRWTDGEFQSAGPVNDLDDAPFVEAMAEGLGHALRTVQEAQMNDN
jgi:hypothetical protein